MQLGDKFYDTYTIEVANFCNANNLQLVESTEDGRRVFTITELPAPTAEQLRQQIEDDWNTWLNTGIEYTNGKKYKPCWLFDTYPATLQFMEMLQLTEYAIGDESGTASGIVTMTKAELLALCMFLKDAWSTAYAQKALRLEEIENVL